MTRSGTLLLLCVLPLLGAQEVGIAAFPGTTRVDGPFTLWGGYLEYRYFQGESRIGREEYFKAAQPYKQEHYRAGKLDGVIRTWYPNGKPETVVDYQAGMLSGEWKDFGEDGESEGVSRFIAGTGIRRARHANGTWRIIETYKDGKHDGNTLEYYPNGNLRDAVFYVNGVKSGVGVNLYEDGRIKGWGEYNGQGRLNGLVFSNENGKLSGTIFADGMPRWSTGDGGDPPAAWADQIAHLAQTFAALRVPERFR